MNLSGLIALVLLSCCINVVILELQISLDPRCTSLITCAQFVFIAAVGFAFLTDFGRRKRVIPIRHYILLTAMYFAQSFANNRALSYNISMPLHMIIKSGSLAANMLLGAILMKARYPLSKIIAVILVTMGIALCTLASANESKKVSDLVSAEGTHDPAAAEAEFLSWCTGVLLVLASVLMSSGMGIYQEILFRRFGRHANEGFFYCHALPLPSFALVWDDLVKHFHIFNASAPWTVGLGDFTFPVPKLWLLLGANVITQYMGSSSVFSLVSIYSSLTVTLVITIRKFLSLLISIYLFKNVFTPMHWTGTVFVFIGTLLYTELIRLPNSLSSKPKSS